MPAPLSPVHTPQKQVDSQASGAVAADEILDGGKREESDVHEAPLGEKAADTGEGPEGPRKGCMWKTRLTGCGQKVSTIANR